MAGYVGTKAVLLSTTAANVGGDADIGGALDVGGAFTSQGIDDNATSTAMTLDASGNVGIGVVPSAWNSAFDAVQVGRSTALWSQNNYDKMWLTTNTYLDTAGNFKYINSAPVTTYNQTDGTHQWSYAASGTAGNTATLTEAMRIDAAGRVTKPNQPSFRAYRATAGNVTYGSGNIISASMTSTNYNVGGHYNTSNGRFTAPIAGRYLFWCALYNNSVVSGRRIRADINGGVGVWGQNQSHSYSDWTTSGIADLSAGDYVHMVSAYSDTVVFHDVNHSLWGGYLIG